jgi:glycine/D-amino acid oxidase-like deaminating enzyme/nitrite reductase/ring-hydroxylating ferredoxin subunit
MATQTRNHDSGGNPSLWGASVKPPVYPGLDEDVHVDVCVVGGGIAGLSTAYLLTAEGRSVAVLDAGAIGGGQTSRTSAHLSNAIDDRYAEIQRLHGEDAARLAAESHTAAIDRIESIVQEERITCEFARVDGYLFLAPGQREEELERELSAATSAGLDVQRVPRAPIPAFDTGPSLRFPGQGQFHPLKYVTGLARAIVRRGGQLFSRTHATRVHGGKEARVETSRGPVVDAGSVVVATNVPFNDRVAIHTKQAAYLTYVIAAPIPGGSVPTALYWDTGDPYHYLRLQKNGNRRGSKRELLLVGGEDHRTGQAGDSEERFLRLESWARERFPELGPVEFHWSGQVMEPVDGLAYIGRNPLDDDNVYIVTGDSGQGLTHGTIAGILLTDQILGRVNPWSTLYSPSRKSLRAAAAYAQENAKTIAQYADWLTAGDLEDTGQIPNGRGALVRRGLRKIAVYRDERGALHEFSATCPHLGCIVQWNDSERTWDCPCHGSRFRSSGRVIVGPANRDLTQLKAP